MKFNFSMQFKYLLLIVYAFYVWFPVLNFEFLRAYEALWLGPIKDNFDFLSLYRNHSYLYYLDYRLFGWNAKAWYLTGLITHIIGAISFIELLRRLLPTLGYKENVDRFALIFGLIFIGSFVYLDVVSWGSFNSYYGLLLFLISTTLIQFLKFERSSSKIFLLISLITFFIGLVVRETAIFAIVMISAIIISKERPKTKPIEVAKEFLKKLLPYLGIFLLFLVLRSLIGGVTGDMNDENVRSRLMLIANKEYGELLWRIVLTFFRNAASLFLPFPWLNNFRSFLIMKFPTSKFVVYFLYSAIGFVAYSGLTIFCLREFRKKSVHAKIFAFSWIIVSFSLLLIAAAIPAVDGVMVSDYNFFTRRYNYFAFLGISIYISLTLIWLSRTLKSFNPIGESKLLVAFVIGFLIFNFFILRNSLDLIYAKEHAEYKQFLSDFKRVSKDFNDNKMIFYPASSPEINDYLLALSMTKSSIYKDAHDNSNLQVESQLNKAFQKLSEGRAKEDNVLFLAFKKEIGLLDFTSVVLKKFHDKIKISLRKDILNIFSDKTSEQLIADIPLEISFDVKAKNQTASNQQRFSDFMSWYKNLSAQAGPTLSQRPGEAFDFCKAQNAITFDLNKKLNWCADGYSSFIELTSQNAVDIYGLWMMSPTKNELPSKFQIVYLDQFNELRPITFEESLRPWGSLLIFKQKIHSNNIKLVTEMTYQNYPIISQINILSASMLEAVKHDNMDIPKIMSLIKLERSNEFFWVDFEWILEEGKKEIKTTSTQFINLSNSERHFSLSLTGKEDRDLSVDRFLKTHVKSVLVQFPKDIEIENLKLNSKY